MRILVTNDDGIHSLGLHALARAVQPHGEVVVVAPNTEYSGSSASIGALFLSQPEVSKAHIEGVNEAWSVTGPPALCTMFARMGVFGGPFDLVVSGINPGSNVGSSVYYSGTIGAATVARNAGITGLAVSQAVEFWGVEGQGWQDALANQRWEVAAEVAGSVVERLVKDLPDPAVVINLNVPNKPLGEIKGWRSTFVDTQPPRSMSTAELVAKPGLANTYKVQMKYGEPVEHDPMGDSGAVMHDYISVSYLAPVVAKNPEGGAVADALDGLFD